ncbi:UDP-N-acetylmuramoylalanyl-D-glutamate--2,6- diaminopimelate ligase [Clostridiaceae bacterium JG1575]|nr:UDP-N-acetylmuramoylalanyl-D-glutamate--2,6- diaminopimelate ligase [Clostridiaceae bacterium JG1575]
MKLGELFQEIPMERVHRYAPERSLDLITNESKACRPGALYVAIPGQRVDGHWFLKEVLERGAEAAIVQHIDESLPLCQIEVPNSRRAWSALSAVYYGHPSRGMMVYGITATNGKTTISFMLDSILRGAHHKPGLIGTVKIRLGDELLAAQMTTPEAFVLQRYFREMADHGLDSCVMEVSSSALEQDRAADVAFDVVSFNNFSREHIDQHGSLEAYWQAKASLITQASSKSVAVINLDDARIRTLQGQSAASFLTYGIASKDADLLAVDLQVSGPTVSFTLLIPRPVYLAGVDRTVPAGAWPMKVGSPGQHTVANALACCAMALAGGIKPMDLAPGLLAYGGVERRFEVLYHGPFTILDDHFANQSNIRTTLSSLSQMDYNKLHICYAIRGNRGVIVNRENVAAMAPFFKDLRVGRFIATQTLGEVTEKDVVHDEERAAFLDEAVRCGLAPELIPPLDEAIEAVLDAADSGDLILLAGCQGMDLGAGKILTLLAQRHPEQKAKILWPLNDRVCGQTIPHPPNKKETQQ